MFWLRHLAFVAGFIAAFTSFGAAATPTPEPDTRTFVTIRVNTVDQGEALAVLRGKDVLVPLVLFDAAGVHNLKGARLDVRGQQYVSLESLAPEVQYKLDLDALSLDVTVGAKHLATTNLDLSRNKPADIHYTGGKSAYVNYAFTDATGGAASAFFDGGFSHDQDALHYSFTASRGEAIRRGLIYYQMDDRATSDRRVIGDVNANSGDLGGSRYLAGLGFSRAFDLDPYAIYYPLPSLSGVATSPSVASVYVNGVLVQRVNLPPGAFNLGDLPVSAGSANTQVILTDAFGRTQSYSQNYYVAANLLKRGLTDYELSVGMLRNNPFAPGDSYGPAAAVGRYRVGLTEAFTAGGRIELTPHLASGGPEFDLKLPLGFLHAAVAGSEENGNQGAAASLGYSFSSTHAGIGLSLLAETPHYATISQDPSADRTLCAYGVSANIQVGRGSALSMQYFRRQMRDSGANDQLAVSDTVALRHGITLTIGAEREHSTNGAPFAGVSAMLNFAVGKTQLMVNEQGGLGDSSVSVSRSPDQKYGLAYSGDYSPSRDRALNASAGYRSPYGDVAVDYSNNSSSAVSESVRLTGGLAFIDGGIYPTRPVLGSFALIDVPNVPDVKVYAENSLVGKTNRKGKLLVPDLLPNYGNDIRIDDRDVPVNTSIQVTQRRIAPAEQAGSVVVFGAHQLHALGGTLVVNVHGKPVVPRYGELTLLNGETKVADSILGGAGEFYLENVPPGAYKALIVFQQGTCTFDFSAPEEKEILVKLGTLGCAMP